MDKIGAESVANDFLFFVEGDISQYLKNNKEEVAEEVIESDKLESLNKGTPEQELLQAAKKLIDMAKKALEKNEELFNEVENETRLKLKSQEYLELLKTEEKESEDSIEIKALLKEITKKKYYSLLSGLLYNKENHESTKFFNLEFVRAAEKFKQKLDAFLERKTLLTIVDKNSGNLKILNEVEEEKLLTSSIVTDKHRLEIPSVSKISFTSSPEGEKENKLFDSIRTQINTHSKTIKETYLNTRKRITKPKEALLGEESPTGNPIEWKKARNKWIVWMYKEQNKGYLQFRTVQSEGAVAEGYVAALFDKKETHDYYYIKDNIKTTDQKNWNEDKELNMGILYSYIKQVNNMAGILQEDVKVPTEEGENIFLAVKTQNASTGSYTSFFAVAEAVIFMFGGQNQSGNLINSNSAQNAKETIENKKRALQKVIQDISTEKIKINNVFNARDLIKDIGEALPEGGQ